jgi:hypothetical protein
MKLSTGKKPFKIEFDTGDVETIYFNPSDPDLAEKLNSLGKRVEERIKNLKDIEIDEQGNPVNANEIEIYSAFKTALYEEIDKTFGYPVCEKVFKHCSALASVDGEFFIKQFVNNITPEIEKEILKEQEKMQKHIGEYVNK